jgi:hypothetical protein
VQALGVLLFVLCFGRLPFAGDSKLQILNGKYEMPAAPSRAPQVGTQLASKGTAIHARGAESHSLNNFSSSVHAWYCPSECGGHLP